MVPIPTLGRREQTISFKDERNGFLHPLVNPQILREVADVAKNMNPGGLDKGGMQQYEDMIHNMAEDEGKVSRPPLRVDGGEDASNKGSGIRVKRRRR